MQKKQSLIIIILVYTVTAFLWFYLANNYIFEKLKTTSGVGFWLKESEDLIFVVFTGILLYVLIRRNQKQWLKQEFLNKNKEEALTSAYLERFKTVTSATNDVLWDWDIVNNIAWRNDNYEKLFGYSNEEAANAKAEDWFRYLHQDDRLKESKALEEILKSDQTFYEHEYRFITKSGKILNILDRSYIFRDEAGNPIRMVGSMQDITSLRSFQQSLQLSEEHYRKIVETAHEGIWQIDENGFTTFVNPSITTMLGYTKDEMMGQSVLNFIFEEDKTAAKDKMKTHLKGDKLQFEFKLKQKNNEAIWILAKGAPVFENGVYKGSIGMITDISELKKSTKRLEESEQNYRLIFKKNPMPMWVYNNKTFEFMAVNEAALKHYGYKREDFLKLKVTQIRPQSELERFLRANDIHDQSIRHAGIWKHFKNDGELIDVEILSENILYEGKNAKLVLIHDITDKLKADQQLQKSYAEIRQLARHLQNIREEERKHVAREIHDELGQQLTAAKMNIAWSEKRLPASESEVKDKLKLTIELLDDSNNSVRNILNELRTDFISKTSISETLEWQARKFERLTGIDTHTNIEQLHTELDEAASICLYRTLQETLTNITRYAKAGNVDIEFKKNDFSLHLIVKDNGIGFDPGTINSQQSFGWLGIKERVNNINGKFELTSSPGNGTSVHIQIPLSNTTA